MAPENAPSLVILDTRIENGDLRGSCEYIEPRTPGARLRVRWAVQSQPEDFAPVGGGVAYIYAKGTEFESQPVSKDAIPVDLGEHRYRWTEGLGVGIPWVMFILISARRLLPLPAEPGTCGYPHISRSVSFVLGTARRGQ